MQPRPPFSVSNSGYVGATYAELGRQHTLFDACFAQSAYFADLIFSQSGNAGTLTFGAGTVPFAIRRICCAGVVAKVIKSVVTRIAVVMADFGAVWTRAYKSLHNKAMDVYGFFAVCFAQNNQRIPASCVTPALKYSAGADAFSPIRLYNDTVEASHSPKIADFIQGISRDWFPNFVHFLASRLEPHRKFTAGSCEGEISGATLAANHYYTSQGATWPSPQPPAN